ncbi:MAG: tetratricopeptide repeat protein [Polyangiales bacterium]
MKHRFLQAYRAQRALFTLLCTLAVAVTAHVPHALGQEARDPGEPTAYRSTVREALSEYHAKNFPEARALFEEAHRLYPNARTLRGLGMTLFELRSYRESVSFLKSALDSQVKPLDGGLRLETERLLTRAERFVGKLTIQVTPAETNVTVDGNPVTLTSEPVVLDVGEHSFEFHAEGYLAESRSLYVKGRESETWTVVLNKVAAPVVAAPAPVVPSPEETARQAEEEPHGTRFVKFNSNERRIDRPLYKNPWLWTGVAVVVVAAVIVPVVLATRDDEIAAAQVNSANTPAGGVFSALEASR